MLKIRQIGAKRKELSIIVKPTHDCNLKCKYCYVGENINQEKISKKLLIKSIDKVSNFANTSHWI